MIKSEVKMGFPSYLSLITIFSFKIPISLKFPSSEPSPPISLSHAMRPGLQIRHFWVAKSLFLTITFHQKKQDKTFCF